MGCSSSMAMILSSSLRPRAFGDVKSILPYSCAEEDLIHEGVSEALKCLVTLPLTLNP